MPNTVQGSYATPYETGAAQLYPLGQRLECPNGRTYRYAEMGATTAGVIAKLFQSEVNANFDTLSLASAIVVGDTSVVFTNGATEIPLNELAGGYVIYEETDNLGEPHRIRANTATSPAGAGTVYLFEGDSFQVALGVTANDVITLVKSPFKDIIITPGSGNPTGMVVGIPQVVIAVDQFGWVQTHGVASCLADDTNVTILIAKQVRPSEVVAGAMAALDYSEAADADTGVLGWAIEVAPDADFGHLYLELEGL